MATATIPSLKAETREALGTRVSRRLRKAGRLPGNIYGHGQEPVQVTFDTIELGRLLENHAHMLNVEVGSATESCLVKDVQFNHLGNQIIHIDLIRVNLEEVITLTIELAFGEEPKAAKAEGAVLEHPTTELEISCKASDIPESIFVDLADLTVDNPISAGDVNLPEGVTLVTDPEAIVAVISVLAEEPEAEEEASTEEPQIIGKKDEAGKAE